MYGVTWHRVVSRVVLLLVWHAAATAVLAQETGRVSGSIVDETGGVLPGVTVQLDPAGLTTVTGADGTYAFEAVPAGAATLTFRLINFSVARRDLAVPVGATVIVDATLRLALTADVVVARSGTSPTWRSRRRT